MNGGPAQPHAQGRRLLRRVLVRPAVRRHTAFVAALVFAYAMIERAEPPPEVRRLFFALPETLRTLVLTVAWGGWVLGSRAGTSQLLGSASARALRSLPIRRRDWIRALAPVLLTLQLPAAIVAAYGLWPHDQLSAVGLGLALALAGACTQPHLISARQSSRIATWTLLLCLPAASSLTGKPGLVTATLAGAFALALGRGLARSPREERGVGRRRIRWCPAAWTLARPGIVAILMRRWVWALLGLQVILALHVAFALDHAAARPGDALTMGVLWIGAVGSVAVSHAGRRRAASSGWYLESLPVGRRLAVAALAVPAFLFSLPAAAATGIATLAVTGPVGAVTLWLGVAMSLWAGAFAARIALDEDRERGRSSPYSWGLAAIAVAVLLVACDRARAWILLPLAAVEALRAWRIEPRARKTRRRFEAYGEQA